VLFLSHVFGPRSPLHGTKIGDKLSPRLASGNMVGRLGRLVGWSVGWLVGGCWMVGWLDVVGPNSRASSSSSSHLRCICETWSGALQAANGGGAGFRMGESPPHRYRPTH